MSLWRWHFNSIEINSHFSCYVSQCQPLPISVYLVLHFFFLCSGCMLVIPSSKTRSTRLCMAGVRWPVFVVLVGVRYFDQIITY